MRETTMKRQHLLFGLILASVGVLAACNSDSPTAPPATPTPTAYTMVLTATPGQALVGSSILFQATVSAGSGVVADGTSVTFTVSGCVPGGATDPAFENGTCEIVRTTSSGRATATLSSNTAGSFQVVARVPQKEASAIVTFSHSTTPGDLAIYSITPNRGRPEGGEQVVIRGRGFATPVTVDFRVSGSDYHAQVLSVSADGAQIQAITPALPQGTTDERIADLVVTAAAGTTAQTVDTMVGAFIFERPFSGPMIYAVTPSAAVVPGPVSVSILGSGFVTPVRVEMSTGAASEAQQVVAVNAAGTQIDILAGPTSLGAGARDVRVVTRAGTAQEQSITRSGGFTWAPTSTEPGAPVVLVVQPNRGSPRGGEIVTLYGDNFCAQIDTGSGACTGVPDVFFDIGSPINARRAAAVITRATDGRSMTVRTPEASPQPVTQDVPVSIVVENSTGSYTATNAFVYASEADLAIYSVVPNRGKAEGGDTVTILGRGFIAPVNVVFSIAGVDRTAQVVSVSAGKDQIQLVTPPGNLTATEEVIASITVTAAAGTSGEQSATMNSAFTYEKPLAAPMIYEVSPPSAIWPGPATVTIFGAGFFEPVRVRLDTEDQEVLSVNRAGNQIQIKAGPTDLAPGFRDLTVTTRAGTTQEQTATRSDAFYWEPPSTEPGVPVVLSVQPDRGSPRGGETITIHGSNFCAQIDTATGACQGLPTVDFIVGTPVSATRAADVVTRAADGRTMTVRTPEASPAPVTTDVYATIRVKNSSGEFLADNAFLYIGESRPPLIYYLQPDRGSARGGEQVVINGRFLLPPVNVLFEPGGAAEVTDVSSDGERVTIITPAVSVQPLPADTPADITVTSQYGTGRDASVTLTNGFLYIAEQPTPEIYSLTPNSGPIDGGTRVTITGRGFQYPVEVTFEYPTGQFRQAQVVSVNFTTVVCLAPSVAPAEPDTPAIAQVQVTNVTTGKASNTLPFRYGEAMFISAIAPGQGTDRGGDEVTIYGQGFAAPVTVTFAGIPAQPLTVGGTLILARTGRVANRQCTSFSGLTRVINVNSNLSAEGPNFTYMPSVPLITSVSVAGTGASGNTLPQPGTACASGTYVGTVFGFDFEAFANGDSAMRVTLGTTPPVEAATTWNGDGSVSFVVPDLSSITLNEVECGTGTTTGMRYVPTPVNVTLTNLDNTCTDTLNSALVILPCDTSCRISGEPPTITLAPETSSIRQGSTGMLTATISVAQPTDTVVNLASSNPGVASVPATVTIPAGFTSANITVTGVAVGGPVSIAATLPVTLGGASDTADVTVFTIGLTPAAVTMFAGTTATLTLSSNPPLAEAATFAVASSNPTVASVPASAVIAAGTASITFNVTAVSVGSSTVTVFIPATLGGGTLTSAITVNAATLALTPDPLAVVKGGTGTMTATLGGPAVAAVTVGLVSASPGIATVPVSVTIPAGSASASFAATGIELGSAVVTGTLPAALGGGTDSATVTVGPVSLLLTPSVFSIQAGGSQVVTAVLNAAQTTATLVTLGSSAPLVASVPASFSIPAGATSATFTVIGEAIPSPPSTPSAIITARLPATLGSATATTAATITDLTLSLSPSVINVVAATETTVAVNLGIVAAKDILLTLSSDSPLVAMPEADVPPNPNPGALVIPAGSSTATFKVKGLSVGSATITADPDDTTFGPNTASGSTTVQPLAITLTPATATITGALGSTTPLTVSLNVAVATPVTVTLTSADATVISVPATVLIRATTSSAVFSATSVAHGGPVAITAALPTSLGGASATSQVGAQP